MIPTPPFPKILHKMSDYDYEIKDTGMDEGSFSFYKKELSVRESIHIE
jgi:hypothetical protein